MPMVPDHLIPKSLGGATERTNLWPACRRCNEFKGERIKGIDPLDSAEIPLFNPRTMRWDTHVVWRDGGVLIEGITPCGRATVATQRLNRKDLVKSRRRWVSVGWHPPKT